MIQGRQCAQRGCAFASETAPKLCPVCGHPYIPMPSAPALTKSKAKKRGKQP
jgi:hypothetical protein